MKALKEITSLLLLFVLISGCASLLYPKKDLLMGIHKGMSQQEVQQNLGKPDYRRFNGDLEEWEYRKGIWGNEGNTIIVIGFIDGRVVRMDSFSDDTPSVVATPAPTSVVEIPNHSRRRSLFFLKKMDDDTFDAFYNKVKNKPFKDDKFELLGLKAKDYSFSCKQCIKLMNLFTFDDEKLNVVDLLASSIRDKENYDNVIDDLDFISTKEKAKKILEIK
ncbi:MAG: DUF4476 domain-containing protein [Bacteroides sp.]|jgi:hypothetical protein|nr:DUF4476 domain-containing protein [Bacteroides sp.]MCI1683457.1 DUF4476 domain-containing protein [Bacteroides sp.]